MAPELIGDNLSPNPSSRLLQLLLVGWSGEVRFSEEYGGLWLVVPGVLAPAPSDGGGWWWVQFGGACCWFMVGGGVCSVWNVFTNR